MPDDELLNELQIKAAGLGLDMRFLIGELVKRYKIKCFEVAALRERIATAPAEPRNDRG